MQDYSSSSSSSSSSASSSSNSSTSMSTESYNINNTTTATNYTRLSFEIPTTNQHDTNSSSGGGGGSNLTLKPHRSSDFSYSAIAQRRNQLTFRDFRLIRRVGSGDIGTVYLCRLMSNSDGSSDGGGGGDGEYYAMKVVDREAVAVKKKKAERAEMERKILKMVDHPFLPTLYAEFEASHFSCFVMEFCSGGDLHSLRHRHPTRRFPLPSARSPLSLVQFFLLSNWKLYYIYFSLVVIKY